VYEYIQGVVLQDCETQLFTTFTIDGIKYYGYKVKMGALYALEIYYDNSEYEIKCEETHLQSSLQKRRNEKNERLSYRFLLY
jgi:hypothetical protein